MRWRLVSLSLNASSWYWDVDSKDADGASVASQKKAYDAGLADGKPHLSLNQSVACPHRPSDMRSETHQTTVTESLPYLMKKLKAKVCCSMRATS